MCWSAFCAAALAARSAPAEPEIGVCGGRIDVRFLKYGEAKLCRTLNANSCPHFFILLHGAAKPCSLQKQGTAELGCAAAPAGDCATPRPPRRPALAEPQVSHALLRQRRLLRRAVPGRVGQPCTSSVSQSASDAPFADCEPWCIANVTAADGVPDSCKYCKCRACRACHSGRMPAWATSTIAGVRASCSLFGMEVCNSTGNLSATIRAVEAAAYAKWEYNHTNMWIDAVFGRHYASEGAVYAAGVARGEFPRLVAAEDGLGDEELATLRAEQGKGAGLVLAQVSAPHPSRRRRRRGHRAEGEGRDASFSEGWAWAIALLAGVLLFRITYDPDPPPWLGLGALDSRALAALRRVDGGEWRGRSRDY